MSEAEGGLVTELRPEPFGERAVLIERSQGQVSETERRQDLRLSTLRSYVEALGGELEVIASFGDKRIKLHSA